MLALHSKDIKDCMGRPRKQTTDPDLPFDPSHDYRCLCCGKNYENPVGHFYKSQWSKLYVQNSQYLPICKDCVDALFADLERRYSTKKATMILCHYLDVPFYHAVYDAVISNNNVFSIGMYMRTIQMKQYSKQDFSQTILTGELNKTDVDLRVEKEEKWTPTEKANQKDVISVCGYDPFDGYASDDRRFLYGDLIKYFDDDISEDPYKLSQILQIVINNNQIRKYDILISRMDPRTASEDVKNIVAAKQALVNANDKIAKENEISVKNRSNKEVGRSTLGYLMRRMREADIPGATTNYYDQLRSDGTQWAADMSMKAIKLNTFFGENEMEQVFAEQRRLIEQLTQQVDDLTEQNRLLRVEAKGGKS